VGVSQISREDENPRTRIRRLCGFPSSLRSRTRNRLIAKEGVPMELLLVIIILLLLFGGFRFSRR
jgi:hypothetical protein